MIGHTKENAWFFRSFFALCLLSYVGFSLLEEFSRGFVSRYFNLNWLLLAVLASAIPLFRAGASPADQTEAKRGRPWLLMAVSSVATVGVIFVSAGALDLGWRLLLSAYGGLMTAAILSVLFEE